MLGLISILDFWMYAAIAPVCFNIANGGIKKC